MQAGNLAAIQSKPTVIPAFDSLADLYGQKVLTNAVYQAGVPTNFTATLPQIGNNEDVLNAIQEVNDGKYDAFIWDALVVLNALKEASAAKDDVCVVALKKRVTPFEIGFGVGKVRAAERAVHLQHVSCVSMKCALLPWSRAAAAGCSSADLQ